MSDIPPPTRPVVQPTVLVVDDDLTTRKLLFDLLTYWGYRPVIAEGYGELLQKDAITKARQHCCQIALIDMRLKDNGDTKDISGLELIPQLEPTKSIVLSGFLDKDIIRRIIRAQGGLGFVGKDEMPEGLKNELAYVTEKICAAVRGVQIGPQKLIDEIKSDFLSIIPHLAENEIEDLLGQLFPEANEIIIERLEGTHQSSTLSAVPRPKSAILQVTELVQGNRHQPVVVKLARAEKMEAETNRYRRHISGRLVGFFNPTLEHSEILWNLGGAKYSHLGNTHRRLETFSTYFGHASVEEIQRSLRQFFGETWTDLYTQTRSVQPASLFEAYCFVWERDWFDGRIKNFTPLNPAAQMGEAQWRHLQACEPIQWLIEHVRPDNDASFMEHVGFATTHGDLHGDNMLIDDNYNAWVIDFERSGPGPILQDFVELESDLLNRLTCASNDFPSFYKQCLCVVACEHQLNLADPGDISDPVTRKALQVITVLRELASAYIDPRSDAREYLWSLLFNTLFRATLMSPAEARYQERALMLASIICHRIEHWGEAWPPAHWPASST